MKRFDFDVMAALLLCASRVLVASAQEDEDAKKKELPLEPTRTIEIVTDEATWLSLDVSPDGTELVLEILGDLYTLPIEGGEASPITSGLAFDSQPRFSPDGRRIAFLSDRDGAENVWIMNRDGSEPKKLSSDTDAEFASPTFSADGDYVIASRTNWGQATYELWMYHVQGGAGVQITKAKPQPSTPRNQRHNALGAVASPDGRYLYYSRRQGGFQYNAQFPMWQVARRDLTTGDEDVLTSAQGSGIRPALSPDGTKVVYGTRFDGETGLRLRDLTTGSDRWLLYPVQRDDQESAFTRDLLPGYAFTPDGEAIVLSYGGTIHRVTIENGSSTPIPFEARLTQELGPRLHFDRRVEEGPLRARLIQDPSLSPDGTHLLFSSLARVYVMELPGGTPRALSASGLPSFQPAWSPDGTAIAFVSWSNGEGHVWRVNTDGTGGQRLSTRAAFYSDPVWSPDGERIVALRGSAYDRFSRPVDFGATPGMDLVWLPAGGGEATLILPARGLGKPHFTNDPDRIYVYLSSGPFSGGGHGLASLRYDGTERREHLKVTGPGIYFAEEPVGATDARMSPDGRWALVHVGNQLHLVAVTRVGGEALTVDISSPSVPAKKLTDIGADYFGWADEGRTITWAIGASFFSRPVASIQFEDDTEAEDDEDAEGSGEASEPAFVRAEDAPEVSRTDVVIEVDRPVPAGTVVLRGARVVTMRAGGNEVIENADVVVEGNRVRSVGPRGSVPPEVRVIDVSGKTIVPGFVDTHAHWFEIRRGLLDLQNWSFLANLAYGVTTGLDVQTSTNDMFAYQDLVEAGVIAGPRAYSTGPGIFSDNQFESLDHAKSVLSRYRDFYRTRNLKSYIVGNRRQRHYVVQAAKELEMMPTTEGALDLKLDITHALDGFAGNEHSLPIVPLYKDVVELFAQSRIGYTPTLLVAYGGPWAENYFYTTTDVHGDEKLHRFLPHNLIDANSQRRPWFREEEHVFPKIAAAAASILRAGGLVGVGSHGQLQGLGYHWELWSLASGGLTPHEALRAATLHGAEIIGLASDIGSLETGKLADLVVLDQNPLDDIRNTNTVRYVMKNGELFEGATLDRVWPTAKELEPLWWWDESPTPSGAEAAAAGARSR